MPSTTYLKVGSFNLDWTAPFIVKNFTNLFTEHDRKEVIRRISDCGEIVEQTDEAFSAPLPVVARRLSLMGYNFEDARRTYQANFSDLNVEGAPVFEDFAAALGRIDLEVDRIDPDMNNSYQSVGDFFLSEIFHEIGIEGIQNLAEPLAYIDARYLISCLNHAHPNSTLQVSWNVGAVGDFRTELFGKEDFSVHPYQKTLILTEGPSDRKIIEKSLSKIYPDLSLMFAFIDSKETNPFKGAPDMVKLIKGLVAIGVEKKILVVFDNDEEGFAQARVMENLNLPANIGYIMLPDLEEFQEFPAVGPNGIMASNINGRAVAIECFCDFSFYPGKPIVDWSTYRARHQRWHGALRDKEVIETTFHDNLDKPNYDLEKMSIVIELIVEKAATLSKIGETSPIYDYNSM